MRAAKPRRRIGFSVISWRLGVVVAVCGIAGCTAEADRKALQDGFAKYNARQLDQAEAIASKYIASEPPGPNIDEAYYLRGLARLTAGNHAGAVADLRDAIKRTSRPDLKGKAFREIADAEFDQARWPEAQQDYEQALAQSGGTLSSPATAHVNFRIGACLQAQGDWTRAESSFAHVIAANADPALAAKARIRMHAEGFALQFGAFQNAPNARQQADELQAAGITAVIASELRDDGQLWFFVRSGTYKTWAQAVAAREQMQAKYPLVAIVP